MISIGALARGAGVSVQTLRHYDRLGLLRPARATAAGYRLYGDAERTRLDVIRSLRALDFDLETIGRLLRGATDMRDAAALQLRALDVEARLVERRRAILRTLLRGRATHERLARLQALTAFERRDREAFLARELRDRLAAPTSSPFSDWIVDSASVDLPDDPTADQVEAWLELAELVSDREFLARFRSPTGGGAPIGKPDLQRLMTRVYVPAAAAARAGVNPARPRARRLANAWVKAWTRTPGRVTRDRLVRFLDDYERNRDVQAERFWQLLAVLRPAIAQSPISTALPFLVASVRAAVGRSSRPRVTRSDTRGR